MDNYLVQTWSQTKSSGIIIPEGHGVKKILNTNSLPEKQKIARNLKKDSENKSRWGQDRAGIKCKKSTSYLKYWWIDRQITGNTENTCNTKYS